MARRRRGSKGNNVSVNLDETEVRSFKPLAEGVHEVEVVKVETKQGPAADYLKVEFETSKGKKLWHNLSLAPNALFSLKAFLLAIGFEIPEGKFDFDPQDFVGEELEVEVAHELYEGEKKAKIIEFIDPDDSEGGSSEDGEAEELLEDLDKTDLKELAKELGTKTVTLKKLKSEDDLIDHILDEYEEDDVLDAYDELFGDDDEPDYEDMSLSELKAEAKSRGLKVKRGMDQDDIIEMLEEDDE